MNENKKPLESGLAPYKHQEDPNLRKMFEKQTIMKRELSGYKIALWIVSYILGVITSMLLVK